MSRSPQALVEPAVLVWAREASGFELSELAKKIGVSVEKVEAWELGSLKPSMAQVRKLAGVFKRPISDLFLSEAPSKIEIPHDFRRVPEHVGHQYSAELRRQLRNARGRRELALDLFGDIDQKVSAFVPDLNMEQGAEQCAVKLRNLLKIEVTEQEKWRSPRLAFNSWRGAIERKAILVFQFDRIERSEILGFSISADKLPVIGINRKLKPNGRTFTLMHELCHLALRTSGLCDIEEGVHRNPRDEKFEVFCNSVAAAILVPKAELLSNSIVDEKSERPSDWDESELDSLSKQFSVSEEVILRRLLSLGRTTRDFYSRMRQVFLKRYAQLERQEKEQRANKEMRRNMPQEVISNLGKTFSRLVLANYDQERITLSDASEFLGIKAGGVSKVGQLLRQQG